MSPPQADGTCGDPDPAPQGTRRKAQILAYIVVLGCFLVVPGAVFGLFLLLVWALMGR